MKKIYIRGSEKEQLELHFMMCLVSPVRHPHPNKHVKESKLLISVIPWLPEVAGLNIALLFPLFPPETFHPIPDSERAGVSPSKSLAAPAPQLV